MTERRQQYDRRQTDRRQQKNNHVHPVVFVMLGAIFAGTCCWFYFESQTISQRAFDEKEVSTETPKRSDSKYTKFRNDVLARDLELRNKLKEKRASRMANQEVEGPREKYERRLAELETEYQKHKKNSDKKGSIGWDLKQSIENMKTDAPPY